jgi:two-component system chemotaxis response regulator CheY
MAKILVVDDSESLRGQVKRDLEAAGHQVLEAFDGMNALEVVGGAPDVQLIVCDVNMPRMDGLTFCTKLTETQGSGKYPIFMLTTECSPEMKVKGKENGVVAWITKPYIAEKMLGAVEKVLARSAAKAA